MNMIVLYDLEKSEISFLAKRTIPKSAYFISFSPSC